MPVRTVQLALAVAARHRAKDLLGAIPRRAMHRAWPQRILGTAAQQTIEQGCGRPPDILLWCDYHCQAVNNSRDTTVRAGDLVDCSYLQLENGAISDRRSGRVYAFPVRPPGRSPSSLDLQDGSLRPIPNYHRRHLNIFSVFSAEQREKAKERLRDEINRGYFDDFKELKETQGKMGKASPGLLPAMGAAQFPEVEAYAPGGQRVAVPPHGPSILLVSFRAGAQSMIDSWLVQLQTASRERRSCSELHPPILQLSLVESGALSIPAIRPLVLRLLRAPPSGASQRKLLDRRNEQEELGDAAVPSTVIHREDFQHHESKASFAYAFGDTWAFRRALGIRNRLTGYIFLVDKKGRVRWGGSGLASREEVQALMNSLTRLYKEEASKAPE